MHIIVLYVYLLRNFSQACFWLSIAYKITLILGKCIQNFIFENPNIVKPNFRYEKSYKLVTRHQSVNSLENKLYLAI